MATQFIKLVTLIMPKRTWFQFRLRTLFGVVTASALLFWAHWIAWPSWSEYRLAQSLREKVLQAQTSEAKGAAYEELVNRLQPQTLKRLQRDVDVGIALKAAYAFNNEGNSRWVPMLPDRANAFLAYLTSRTQLEPPTWWAPHFGKRDPGNLNAMREATSFKVEGRDLFVKRGDRSVRLTYPRPARFDEDLRDDETENDDLNVNDFSGCLAIFDSDVAYVALASWNGASFPLDCIDAQDGHTRWRAEIWALGFEKVGSWAAQIYHVAELTLQGDSIVVWGDGVGGSYVESFDAQTGLNRFRFCTEFWFAND